MTSEADYLLRGAREEEGFRQPETTPDATRSNSTTILSEDHHEQLKHTHPCTYSSGVVLDYRNDDSLLPQRGIEPEVELNLQEKALLLNLKVSLEEIAPPPQPEQELESESEPEEDLESEPEQELESESESEPEEDLESEPEPEPEPELTFWEKTWQVLHILRCKGLADLDPKRNALVPTRVHKFNTAFYDLDEESDAIMDRRLKSFLLVTGARLCHHLSTRDELTLTGPSRAFIARDSMFFEINLKIKGVSGVAEGDFSKGVMEHNLNCYGGRAMADCLTSWRSTIELLCNPVWHPVEATLEVKILEGPSGVPFRGKVIAWTDDFEENPMTLFDYDDDSSEEVAGGQGLVRDDGSLALSRNLIAVPIAKDDGEMVLNVCFVDSHDENEGTVVSLQYPCEEEFCTYGSYELQLKVSWKAVLSRPMSRLVHQRLFSLPQPPLTVNSWMWELVFQGNRGCFGDLIIYKIC
ncbi:hypothetical protein ZWY2020_007240 [Hordeum vulgare]|nr:hypothetical protein ZWY2020_007240 [Hordeum vulgare]